MPDTTPEADPGFALVRHKLTGNVYTTKWRDDDLEVLVDDLEVDGAGQPVVPADALAKAEAKPAPKKKSTAKKTAAKKTAAAPTPKEQS